MMDPVTALSTVVTVINTIAKLQPEILDAFDNLKSFGSTLFGELTGTKISDADLETLEAKIDDIHNQIQIPLPPE